MTVTISGTGGELLAAPRERPQWKSWPLGGRGRGTTNPREAKRSSRSGPLIGVFSSALRAFGRRATCRVFFRSGPSLGAIYRAIGNGRQKRDAGAFFRFL